MWGAIIGDIVGSRFEFANTYRKDFTFFSNNCFFTDDTVCTVAVAEALLRFGAGDETRFKDELVRLLRAYVRRYPNGGYGGRFAAWAADESMGPYNSFGNGSAMRVSPVMWYAGSLEEAERLAKLTAEVTHNHPEGIKGAVAVAGAGFLARNGNTIGEIKAYLERFYSFDIPCSVWREKRMPFNETCPGTVPIAMECFLESENFEDAIRLAVSMGGDSDTIAAMTGSVAEAYYGLDEFSRSLARRYLDEKLLSVIDEFTEKYCK